MKEEVFEIKNSEVIIEAMLKKLAESLREEGYPIRDDCRIDMLPYAQAKAFSPAIVKKDMEEITDIQKQWEQTGENESLKIGKKFEVLKTILFNKVLGKNFIAVRSSLYDDIKNKVDNVILNKKTGDIICAFDEVADTLGSRYEEKVQNVLKRNRSGIYLKYGFRITEEGIVLTPLQKIPIFYLALPENKIQAWIKSLTSLEEVSDFERKLWIYFCECIKKQAEDLFKYTDYIFYSNARAAVLEIVKTLKS